MTDVLAPAKLGPLRLRNRIIKAATFEGRTPDAVVTDDLIEFHRDIAAGGVGMTTMAYCAVSPEGRTDRHAACGCGPRRCRACAGSTDAVHNEGAAIERATRSRRPGGQRGIQPAQAYSRRITCSTRSACASPARPSRADIARIVAAHADAARMRRVAGFDCCGTAFRAQLPDQLVPQPALNHRKDALRRLVGEPRPGGPGGRARGPRRRRRPARDHREAQHDRRRTAAA